MEKGFFTFNNFLLGASEPSELKTAALWFDKVLIDVPYQALWEERRSIFLQQSGLDAPEKDELSMIFQSSNSSFPRYSLANINNNQRRRIVAAYNESDMECYRMLARDPMPSSPGLRRSGDIIVRRTVDGSEVAVGKMESILTWANAPAKLGIPLFATPVEHGIIRRLLVPMPEVKSEEILQSFGSLNVPNFSSLPWNRILELRHNPHWNSFRVKMSQLADRVSREDLKSAKEILEDLKNKDFWAMANATEPSPKYLTFKSIVGLFTLGFNPTSIISDILDMVKAHKHNERFGWLYFVRDLGGK